MSPATDISRQPVRKPRVAGFFYPSDEKKLRRDLEHLYTQAQRIERPGTIIGMVAPHAGYVYSGQVAAEAYKQITGEVYTYVIVIAPSHRDFFRGVSVYDGDYSTPLGVLPVDQEMCRKLTLSSGLIQTSDLGHRDEHALEVQIPFIQTRLKDVRLIPLVMGNQDWDTCETLGHSIAQVFQGTASLIIASSDLSHFHKQAQAETLDQIVIKDFERFSEKQLYDHISHRECEACGAGPIIAMMIASRILGATRARVLSYHTSGEVSHDYDQVVGYLSGILYI
jgi:MEMO1 family protein